jgi:hypothetical protein
MAIRDLLWACPVCRTFASIRDAGRGREACESCRAIFSRGPGATIVVRPAGGTAQHHTAADLVDRIPPVSAMPLENGRLGPAPALVRLARTTRPVRDGTDYLGRAELFGPAVKATVTLDDHTLAVGIPENPIVWPLEAITAVQPSSSTLQINSEHHPLASFRFLHHSVRLWEEAIQHRIRLVHERSGRGPIVQFHPHIRFA